MRTAFLSRASLPPLAYVRTVFENVTGPGVIYVAGFGATKEAHKAMSLEKHFNEGKGWRPSAFTRFDTTDKGETVSEDRKKMCGFRQWKEDLVEVIDKVAHGPQLLVGSSMGAWLSLLAAIERPDRVCGILTISASIGFFSRFENQMPEQLKAAYESGETINVGEPLGRPFLLNKLMVNEGKELDLLGNDEPIMVTCPVRLVHSVKDQLAPYKNSLRLLDQIVSEDIELTLLKYGSHQMNDDFDTILRTLDHFGREISAKMA